MFFIIHIRNVWVPWESGINSKMLSIRQAIFTKKFVPMGALEHLIICNFYYI